MTAVRTLLLVIRWTVFRSSAHRKRNCSLNWVHISSQLPEGCYHLYLVNCCMLGEKGQQRSNHFLTVSSSRLICDCEINTESVVIHSLIVKVQIQLISFQYWKLWTVYTWKGIFILTVCVNVVCVTLIESLWGQVWVYVSFSNWFTGKTFKNNHRHSHELQWRIHPQASAEDSVINLVESHYEWRVSSKCSNWTELLLSGFFMSCSNVKLKVLL